MSYTKIPNEIFEPSHMSINARFLYMLLLKHCGQDDYCFPGQSRLGKVMGMSPRHVRNLLDQLIEAGLIIKRRTGFNKTNTYTVTKSLKLDRNGGSYQLGSLIPLNRGNAIPTKSTYTKGQGKRSLKGLESMKQILEKRGIIK